jgi:hypothetical protein
MKSNHIPYQGKVRVGVTTGSSGTSVNRDVLSVANWSHTAHTGLGTEKIPGREGVLAAPRCEVGGTPMVGRPLP